MQKIITSIIITCCLQLANAHLFAQQPIHEPSGPANWSQNYAPFRIAGNLYYVGTYDLGSYLITTPNGHILINTGLASSAAFIKQNIQKLGFKYADIKILLATHAHYDHVAAMAQIKKETGATMMINENDEGILGDGGNSDYVLGGKGPSFAPVKAERLLHNKDTIGLGDMQVVALHHPGHTKGATSFLFDVKDATRTWRVLVANMPSILDDTKLSGMPGYANVGKDYAYTLDTMKKVQFDLFLASHASQFNLHKKHKPGDKYNPAVFIDRPGYEAALATLQETYNKRVKE